MWRRHFAGALVGAVVGAAAMYGALEARGRAGEGARAARGRAGEGGAEGPRASERGAKTEGGGADGAPSSAARASEGKTESVRELGRRLASLDRQKQELQDKLAAAEQQLAASGEGRAKDDFDLSTEDWKQLAQDGTVKYRVPCFKTDGWRPKSDVLEKLGLDEDDGDVIEVAYQKSNARLWSAIKPLCMQVLGGAPEVADKLGYDTCTHLIVNVSRTGDPGLADEAMRQVGEVRAGLARPPSRGEPAHPVFELLYALTGELEAFERDLAAELGPAEAHRLAYSPDMCAGHSVFGGPGPRKTP